MNAVERFLFTHPGGMYREYEGLTTHLAPSDLALYRSLVPPAFDLPDQPVVTIYAADFVRIVPWPLTRYQEWAVLLRCAYKGEIGWTCVTMPVTKWLPMVGGRQLGFPKYVTDSITLSTSGEGREAKGIYRRRLRLALEFAPGITRPLTPWEQELDEDIAFFKKGPAFLLVPPGRGPRIHRVTLAHVVEPQWAPEHGMIRVRVDPGESWAGLLPDEGPFPGTYNHFVGGANFDAEWLT